MMHPNIKLFWEKQGKVIIELTEPSGGYTNVPLYFIEKDGIRTIIAAPCDGKMAYHLNSRYYFEEDALRLIKLSAFF